MSIVQNCGRECVFTIGRLKSAAQERGQPGDIFAPWLDPLLSDLVEIILSSVKSLLIKDAGIVWKCKLPV